MNNAKDIIHVRKRELNHYFKLVFIKPTQNEQLLQTIEDYTFKNTLL